MAAECKSLLLQLAPEGQLEQRQMLEVMRKLDPSFPAERVLGCYQSFSGSAVLDVAAFFDWVFNAQEDLQDDDSTLADGFPPDGSAPLPDLSKHHSFAAHALRPDPDLYNSLAKLRTTSGVALARCIKPGVDHKGHKLIRGEGICACDAECYSLFRPLFAAVMSKLHTLQPEHPAPHLEPSCLEAVDLPVRNLHLRLSRNLGNVRFPCAASRAELREVERVLTQALAEGEYFPLRGSDTFASKPSGMTEQDETRLMELQLPFQKPDSPVAVSAGLGRAWPHARGVYLMQELAVYVNEFDHLRLQAWGSNFRGCFQRLCDVYMQLTSQLQALGVEYSQSDEFGFLLTSPSGTGTGFQAAATLEIPLLAAKGLKAMCHDLGLHQRSLPDGSREISLAVTHGTTATEMMQVLMRGCRQLIEEEAKLAANQAT